MSTYTIRKGDTLSAIAARNHTTVGALAKLNHISNPNRILAGHKLQLPGHDGHDTFEHGSKSKSHSGGSKSSGSKSSGSKSTGKTKGTSGSGSLGSPSAKMKRLAADGRQVALSMGGYHGLGRCATGVSRAIHEALGLTVYGNGNQIDNNLPRSHFKELHISLAQALKTPGLILTWEHTSTRLGSIYGHTAITAGDGHSSYSDFIERDTLAGGRSRTGLRIFMPT